MWASVQVLLVELYVNSAEDGFKLGEEDYKTGQLYLLL
jgi:hypothetical protein